MKITIQQIKQIINEELDRLLYEEDSNDVLRKAIAKSITDKDFNRYSAEYYQEIKKFIVEASKKLNVLEMQSAYQMLQSNDHDQIAQAYDLFLMLIEELIEPNEKDTNKQRETKEEISQQIELFEDQRNFIVDKRIKIKHFSYLDLTNADLRGADLSKADLSKTNLSGADLRGANFYGADMLGADLRGSKLSDANLSNANLNGANLNNVNLSETNLRGANLSYADLIKTNLSNADLRGVTAEGVELDKANLMYANLSGANLNNVNLRLSDLSNTLYNDQTVLPKSFNPEKAGARKK